MKSSNGDDDREGTLEPILLDLKDESENGTLDDANSPPCGSRKRIFSQSDVEYDLINDRKKINPISSALSAAPYYYHDFKTNDKQDSLGGGGPTNKAPSGHFQIKEFHPTNQTFVPYHGLLKPNDLQSTSSFSKACGLPTFSESLTMNDGKTA